MNSVRMLLLFVIFAVSTLFITTANAIDRTATGFYYPTGTSSLGNYADWLLAYPDYPYENKYHIGKDIDADAPNPVYAIADGTVIGISYNGWGTGNVGVFVRHELMDESQFVALYGHVRTSVSINDPVTKGVSFATIGPYSPDHLHFGIHPGGSMPSSPYGKLPLPVTPPYNGWVNPINWITTNAPEGGFKCSYVSHSIDETGPYHPGDIINCHITFQNDGTATWSNNDQSGTYVELASCNESGTIGYSFFQLAVWFCTWMAKLPGALHHAL